MKKIFFGREKNTPSPLAQPTSLGNISDDFFFSTPALRQRLDRIHKLIQSGGLFLLLVGERGAGKGALRKQLLTLADPKWEVRSVSTEGAPPGLAESGLLGKLLHEYNLTASSQDPDSRKGILFDHIEALTHSGGIPLIIVDANRLPSPDDVKLLTKLSSAKSSPGARIILICKPGDVRHIRELMTSAGNGEIAQVDVPPFTEEQVGDYLHLRWNQANPVGDTPFTDGVIRSIYHASKGLPANVNKLAEQFLQNRRPARSRRVRAAGRVRKTPVDFFPDVLDFFMQGKRLAALVAGVVAVSLVLFILFGRGSPRGPEMVTVSTPISPMNTQPINAPPDDIAAPGNRYTPPSSLEPEAQALTSPKTTLKRSAIAPRDSGIITPNYIGAISPEGKTATGPEQIDAINLPEPASASASLVFDPGYPDGSERVVEPAAEATFSREQADVEWGATPPVEVPLMTSRELELDRKEAEDQPSVPAPIEDVTGTPPAAPLPANPPPANPRIMADPGPPEEDSPAQQKPKFAQPHRQPRENTSARAIGWLRQQDPRHYTIQLVGLSTKKRMMRYIEEHRLASRVAWLKTINRGKDLFVVVYGVYPNRKAASAEVKTLPPALRKTKPWPLTIGDLLEKAP
uniref:Sporulation related domain-containing protein n=1 Tax=Candidatus Kentrum sp. DK TaxID=2126562 RepID=A0A450T8S7_9GAMM|nr:MAG: Sporulation related domain-containing protein [Candidatus Kentron sp. DK]